MRPSTRSIWSRSIEGYDEALRLVASIEEGYTCARYALERGDLRGEHLAETLVKYRERGDPNI
jgi:hypothetical protein